jgi:hypothetical protein
MDASIASVDGVSLVLGGAVFGMAVGLAIRGMRRASSFFFPNIFFTYCPFLWIPGDGAVVGAMASQK